MSVEYTYPPQHDTLEGVPQPAENPLLVGHGDAANALAAAHKAGKLPHALLICGAPGIGKATLAFHLAHHLFAHPDPARAPETLSAPVAASTGFRQVAAGAHPSLLHLTRPPADSGKGFKTQLTVDEVRKVGRFLSLTAPDGGWRVVIVDPADDLNRSAANAILKNLEEPPARTVFVLIANAPGSLLPTIRSRCQVVRLVPLDAAEVAAVLTGLGQAMPEDEAERTALLERAGGSPRTALLMLEHGGADIAKAVDQLAAASELDMAKVHRLADAVNGRDNQVPFDIFNRQVLSLMASAAAEAARSTDMARANSLAESWQDARKAISETESYNLDRKVHALTMIARLNAVMRM